MARADKETVKLLQKAVGAAADGIWGPNTMKAVADKLGCPADARAIQDKVGVTQDGIVGPDTVKAVLQTLNVKTSGSVLSVFIDPGHTSDYEREHLSQFTGVDWKNGIPQQILQRLGLNVNDNDSLEHRLNLRISQALQDVLVKRGVDVVLYDAPSLSNGAEIRQVYTRSNAFAPNVFISIHNNAQGGSSWKSLGGTATGTVGLYNTKSTHNKRLAQVVTDSVNWYRKSNGGKNNRASTLQTSSVGVLSNASSTIPACLIEVGFYDNLSDLDWITAHITGIATAIADGIQEYMA